MGCLEYEKVGCPEHEKVGRSEHEEGTWSRAPGRNVVGGMQEGTVVPTVRFRGSAPLKTRHRRLLVRRRGPLLS